MITVCTDLFVSKCLEYTAKNATDLVQVVDFTSLMHFANKLYQACWLHQIASSLWTSDNLTFADLL